MEEIKNIATPAEVLEQLEALNLEILFNDLVSYAMFKMKGESIVEAEKLVGDVFEKAISGVRKWNKSHTFKEFLFGAVKSLVSHYNNQYGKKIMDIDHNKEVKDMPDNLGSHSGNLDGIIKKITEILKNHIPPPDETELKLFECWVCEIKKPRDVADFCDLDIKEVYKAVKRLERKLSPIRKFLNISRNG